MDFEEAKKIKRSDFEEDLSKSFGAERTQSMQDGDYGRRSAVKSARSSMVDDTVS